MRRLGIYGGSFSPPHLGHLRAALQFYDEAGLDELLIMPAGKPPHKSLDGGASDLDRFVMCKLLFSEKNIEKRNVTVSDYELSKAGNSYTYLTLTHYKDEDTKLFFLCGSDMFLSLDTWRNPETVFSLATIFCCSRENDDMDALLSKKAEYEKRYGAGILLSRAKPFPISSSELRQGLLLGKSVEGYLDAAVNRYICEKELYDKQADLVSLRRFVQSRLSEKRFAHVLGVEKECAFLARCCGMENGKIIDLRRAALLHDITHEMSVNEQIELIKRYGEAVPEDAGKHPSVLHQFSGAVYVRHRLPYSKEVANAIACHTTGSPDMPLFDRILCLADYIEESRKYPECMDLRQRVHKALGKGTEALVIEEAMLIYFERTLAHLKEKGCEIHPQTKASYDKLLENTLVKTRIL